MSNKIKEIVGAIHTNFEQGIMIYIDDLGVDITQLPEDVYEKPYMVKVRVAIHEAVTSMAQEFGETK